MSDVANAAAVESPLTGPASPAEGPAHRYTPALANQIELKWQDIWADENTFAAWEPGSLETESDDAGEPYFIMDMFPYPSGAGLHVGHPLGYIASDVVGRYRRMQGDNVLHAMGYDAFGLPAEQYAVQTGQHPKITTEANIATMAAQLRRLGLGHDNSRTFATIDPDYVRWTQWIFLAIFNSWYDHDAVWTDPAGREQRGKARPIAELVAEFASGKRAVPGFSGSDDDAARAAFWASLHDGEQDDIVNGFRLAYVDESPVNWAPGLGTVLANEEVTADGRSERGNFPVFTKPLRQWKMRITAYARRLAEDLDLIDWPEAVKHMQRNWIGQSTGAYVKFRVTPPTASTMPSAPSTPPMPSTPPTPTAPPTASVSITPVMGSITGVIDTLGDKGGPGESGDKGGPGESGGKGGLGGEGGLGGKGGSGESGGLVGASALSGTEWVEVFTTRPDTLYGATFMVVAPEHALLDSVPAEWPAGTDSAWTGGFDTPIAAVRAYQKAAAAKTAVQRMEEAGAKSGVFTGLSVINPVTGTPIPVFTADYVLMGYGTGAIMAVPGGDQRDFEFATAYGLPIVYTVAPVKADGAVSEPDLSAAYVGDGVVINSPSAVSGQESFGADPVVVEPLASAGPIPPATPLEAPAGPGHWGEPADDGEPNRIGLIDDATVPSAVSASAVGGAETLVSALSGPPSLNGLDVPTAKEVITDWLTSARIGRGATNYRLRDWLFSRQRYWGEPFPIVWDADNRPHALPVSDLPVALPEVPDYQPRTFEPDDVDSMPESPLGRNPEWVNISLDLGNGVQEYRRDTNTMPNWAGSCWYYLRYLDPTRGEAAAIIDPAVEDYWMAPHHNRFSGDAGGVDLYIGGVEHAVLHLLYARFWHKVLFDLGYVSALEPFGRLFNQGYIQAYAFTDERGAHVEAADVVGDEITGFTYHGEPVSREYGKMGKSLKNVVTPDEMYADYGADTFRLYEMSMGPLDISRPWNTRDVIGSQRFLARLWRNVVDENTGEVTVGEEPADLVTRRLVNRTIADVTVEMDNLRPNTAIAKLIGLNNHLTGLHPVPREAIEPLVLMIAPLAPHIAEELWQRLRHDESLARDPAPVALPD
ncbi:MAG: leucine--tRNA ligase, partial [Promicromonosporaceae bacterium]|nr:leucine--tRNA ligase [Promicromonosporaceae bacterium]